MDVAAATEALAAAELNVQQLTAHLQAAEARIQAAEDIAQAAEERAQTAENAAAAAKQSGRVLGPANAPQALPAIPRPRCHPIFIAREMERSARVHNFQYKRIRVSSSLELWLSGRRELTPLYRPQVSIHDMYYASWILLPYLVCVLVLPMKSGIFR